MQVLDFFDDYHGFQYLEQIYHLSKTELKYIDDCFYFDRGIRKVRDDGFIVFLKQTRIRPDTFDVSDVSLLCKHISTAIDGGQSIEKYGLKPLTFLLQEETILSSFLKENGVIVNPNEHYLSYNGRKYNLPADSNKSSLLYWDKVGSLCSSLYHDQGEIEAFLRADEKDMLNYSTVSVHPEILLTVDQTLNNLTGKTSFLRSKWKEHKPSVLKVSFAARMDELSYANLMKSNKDYYNNDEVEDFLDNKENLYQLPQYFWWNEWLINRCLYNMCPDQEADQLYVGISNNAHISANRIIVKEI